MRLRVAIILSVLWHCAAGLSAGGDAERSLVGGTRWAPADASLVVVIDHAAEARSAEVGRAMGAIVEGVVVGGKAARAWSALAGQLGWTPEETFDRLLGDRVVFVQRQRPEDPSPTWVVLSHVTLETESRLRDRLAVAPRAIVAGHAILSVERGEYELASEIGTNGALLLLGPAKAPGLFDETVPALRKGRADSLMATAAMRDVRRMGQGEMLAYASMPGAAGEDRTWTALVAARDGMDIVGALLSARACGPDPGERRWSREPFDRMAAGALAAVMEFNPPSGFERWISSEIMAALPLGALDADAVSLLDGRIALAAYENPGAMPDCVAAIETRSVEGLARPADALAASMLAKLGLPGQNFGGLSPEAVRRTDLSAAIAGAAALNWREPPALRWSYRRTGGEAGDRGWWIAGIGGPGFDRVGAALGAPTSMAPRAWMSIGTVRVGRMVECLSRAGVGLPSPVAAMGAVEVVAWEIERTPERRHAGVVTVSLRACEQPRPVE